MHEDTTDGLSRLINQKRPKVQPRKDDLLGSSSPSQPNKDEIFSQPPLHAVVRNSILLEETVNGAFSEFCDSEKIIKAVWIEAAFLYLRQHPEVMDEVNKIARGRLQERKKAAKYRQAESFSKKLKDLE